MGKVAVIEEDAFYGCSNLSSVHINSLSDWCKIELKNVYSNPLYESQGNLYVDNKVVTNLVIPEDVTEIKDYAFCNNKNIKELQIGNAVVSIGKEAFSKTSLTSCLIPENVTSIGESAFANCDSLTTITFGDGIKEIPNKVLNGCSSLTEVVFGKNVEQIAYNAFSNSTSKLPIKKIVCHATTPPACPEHETIAYLGYDYWSAFYVYKFNRWYDNSNKPHNSYIKHLKLDTGVKLYVPAKCGRTYESAWDSFLDNVNVIEME